MKKSSQIGESVAKLSAFMLFSNHTHVPLRNADKSAINIDSQQSVEVYVRSIMNPFRDSLEKIETLSHLHRLKNKKTVLFSSQEISS